MRTKDDDLHSVGTEELEHYAKRKLYDFTRTLMWETPYKSMSSHR